MIRTVVAIESPKLSDVICHALEKNGIKVRYRCSTGAEVIRAINKMGGGVVITTLHLPDMYCTQLCQDLSDLGYVMVLGRENMLADCVGDNVIAIALPTKSSILLDELTRLLDLDDVRAKESIPERSQKDKELILQAKEMIMSIHHINENAAHRYLQKTSMDASISMVDAAKRIIDVYGKE